ncbi:MAG: hypothetical protein M1115_10895 [Actinobacteria bacterium]|nr:hypothetical protein [Actinomycetota bacterium]
MGVPVIQVDAAEVGSGVNGAHRRVHRMLFNPAIGTLVVEDRDRVGRVNIELVGEHCRLPAGPLWCWKGEVDDGLVRDMTAVFTSFWPNCMGAGLPGTGRSKPSTARVHT